MSDKFDYVGLEHGCEDYTCGGHGITCRNCKKLNRWKYFVAKEKITGETVASILMRGNEFEQTSWILVDAYNQKTGKTEWIDFCSIYCFENWDKSKIISVAEAKEREEKVLQKSNN